MAKSVPTKGGRTRGVGGGEEARGELLTIACGCFTRIISYFAASRPRADTKFHPVWNGFWLRHLMKYV